MKSKNTAANTAKSNRTAKRAASNLFIMSCIIPTSTSNIGDFSSIGVKAGVVYQRGPKAGQAVPGDVQQRDYARAVVAAVKRPTNKYITALFTATGAATAILGDAFGATAYADANGTWAFQNGASAGANQLACFKNMVRSQPFKYLGIQIDVAAYSQWSAMTWTESITDYDNNQTIDFKPNVNVGLNTYAQTTTTRFLKRAGEFNGNWGLYMSGITNGQTVNFTFNCVDIDRNW